MFWFLLYAASATRSLSTTARWPPLAAAWNAVLLELTWACCWSNLSITVLCPKAAALAIPANSCCDSPTAGLTPIKPPQKRSICVTFAMPSAEENKEPLFVSNEGFQEPSASIFVMSSCHIRKIDIWTRYTAYVNICSEGTDLSHPPNPIVTIRKATIAVLRAT